MCAQGLPLLKLKHTSAGEGASRDLGVGERAGVREVVSVATRSAAGLREACKCVQI